MKFALPLTCRGRRPMGWGVEVKGAARSGAPVFDRTQEARFRCQGRPARNWQSSCVGFFNRVPPSVV
eukprot:382199-Pyramimonas_sp.AAC.1